MNRIKQFADKWTNIAGEVYIEAILKMNAKTIFTLCLPFVAVGLAASIVRSGESRSVFGLFFILAVEIVSFKLLGKYIDKKVNAAENSKKHEVISKIKKVSLLAMIMTIVILPFINYFGGKYDLYESVQYGLVGGCVAAYYVVGVIYGGLMVTGFFLAIGKAGVEEILWDTGYCSKCQRFFATSVIERVEHEGSSGSEWVTYNYADGARDVLEFYTNVSVETTKRCKCCESEYHKNRKIQRR